MSYLYKILAKKSVYPHATKKHKIFEAKLFHKIKIFLYF